MKENGSDPSGGFTSDDWGPMPSSGWSLVLSGPTKNESVLHCGKENVPVVGDGWAWKNNKK